MTLHRLGQINKNQRGFTLIELVIVLGITSIILGTVYMAFFEVVTYNTRDTYRMTAIKEVEHAIYRITLDVQMTQSVSGNLTAANGLTLNWVDWNGSLNNVTYNVVNGQLQRNCSVNGGQFRRTVEVAHLNSAQTRCVVSGQALSFKITSTIGGGLLLVSETRSFNVTPRCTPITINATNGPLAISTNSLPKSQGWRGLQPDTGRLGRHDALYLVNKCRLSAGGADAQFRFTQLLSLQSTTELKRWWPTG